MPLETFLDARQNRLAETLEWPYLEFPQDAIFADNFGHIGMRICRQFFMYLQTNFCLAKVLCKYLILLQFQIPAFRGFLQLMPQIYINTDAGLHVVIKLVGKHIYIYNNPVCVYISGLRMIYYGSGSDFFFIPDPDPDLTRVFKLIK